MYDIINIFDIND